MHGRDGIGCRLSDDEFLQLDVPVLGAQVRVVGRVARHELDQTEADDHAADEADDVPRDDGVRERAELLHAAAAEDEGLKCLA